MDLIGPSFCVILDVNSSPHAYTIWALLPEPSSSPKEAFLLYAELSKEAFRSCALLNLCVLNSKGKEGNQYFMV